MSQLDAHGEAYEAEHVHAVYEQIASHFSSTRYKPWPIVEEFLKDLPAGAVGLDVGCGNGKYLAVNPHVFIIGSDRSTKLAKIAAAHQPHDLIVADNLSLPHPLSSFDFAISIAVVHHLSTPARRIDAVRAILELLHPAGKALIYVWALEQKSSRRGWDEGHEQDVMVPWVMKSGKQVKQDKSQKRSKGERVRQSDDGSQNVSETRTEDAVPPPAQDKTFQRYYHLYKKGELEQDIAEAGGTVVESGYEKDNWWAVAIPRLGT